MSEPKEEGKSASEMNLKELKQLAVSLKLGTVEEVSDKSEKELLLEITNWEEKALADQKAKEEGEKDNETTGAPLDSDRVNPSSTVSDGGMFNGKKVVSRKSITVNGKEYVDILVEDGVTYRELAK